MKASSKEVKVNIYDFVNREILKELAFSNKAKEIPFANTPLMKLGYGWDEGSKKLLSKPKQIINIMMRQNVAVSASTDSSSNLILSVGSHNYFVPNQSGGMMMTPNPMNQNLFSQVYTPRAWQVSSRVKNAYFQSKLNLTTLAHEKGELKEPEAIARQKKTWRYKKRINSGTLNPVYCEVSFELNNKFYFGHYKRTRKEFEFVHLK